jgi:hypothetical protein
MTETEQWLNFLGVAPAAGVAEVCGAFERVAAGLAPLDIDVPVYCVLTELSPAYAGCFDPLAYYVFRRQLSADRCPGVVLLASTALLSHVPAKYTVEVLCLILAHELCHAICSISSGEFHDWHESLAEIIDHPKMAAAADKHFAPLVDPQQTEAGPQLEAHGPLFTRAMIHLDHRLRAAGVHGEHIAAGERYGQRPFAECVAALGDEPAACIDKRFREILSLPMPVEFAALAGGVAATESLVTRPEQPDRPPTPCKIERINRRKFRL